MLVNPAMPGCIETAPTIRNSQTQPMRTGSTLCTWSSLAGRCQRQRLPLFASIYLLDELSRLHPNVQGMSAMLDMITGKTVFVIANTGLYFLQKQKGWTMRSETHVAAFKAWFGPLLEQENGGELHEGLLDQLYKQGGDGKFLNSRMEAAWLLFRSEHMTPDANGNSIYQVWQGIKARVRSDLMLYRRVMARRTAAEVLGDLVFN